MDIINHPPHYEQARFTCEPMDLTTHLPHPLASAVGYIIRAPWKDNEKEDLSKAVFWLCHFLQTPSFWEKPEGEKYGECLLTHKAETRLHVVACVAAMMEKCPFLENLFALYGASAYIREDACSRTVLLLKRRIAELEKQEMPEGEE